MGRTQPLRNISSQFDTLTSGFNTVCIDKLIKIANEANEFRDLLEAQENGSGSDANRETISNPPARVFGREVDKENIVSLLMEEPLNSEPGPSTRPAIPIIAITGRSGVGKTTLAQYVYKHMYGQEYFDLLIWVHAPRKFKAIDVIKNMIDIMNAKECASNDNHSTYLEALLTQTRHRLGSQKLLLVLDDFWSDTEDFVEQWENLICCCSSSLIGSRILLTTQSKNAAEQACIAGVTAVETYYLKEIEEAQFSYLFMHYAWPSNCQLPKEEFEKIGRKIAVKLKGDPGTAKLVGHQIGGKLDLRHWEEVAENDWSGDNMKARIWSYQQLPLNLQCCFAICSLLPKGIRFPRQLLITLWMAQGFIRPTDPPERLEDIGENYFCELISRYFLEQVIIKEEIYYELHDLLHDLAERVQGDDIIRIDNSNCEEVPSHISHMLSRSSENIRHISLPSSMINRFKKKLCLMKNIRTFCVQPNSVVPKKVLQDILKNFEKLRVLFLPECGDDLPEFIGNLKHLRYLNIYGSQPIKKLPDSICKLYHLQTLVLPYCESLPKDFSELISLRCFETVRDTMFHMSDVGRLTSLQCLDQFVVRNECGNELHQLENLNMLRGSLFITGLENVGSIADAAKANMRNKKHLKELQFEWNSYERDTKDVTSLSTQHVQLLEALQPHPNINVLTLIGFGGDRFPNWLLSQNSTKHLTTLQLCYCGIEEISSIDKSLPSCTSLIVKGLKNLKQMPSLPPKLTYLVVDDILHINYISEGDLLMKEERKHYKLEVVKQIEQCLKLQYVLAPHNFGLTVREFVKFVRERLEASPEICITSSQLQFFISEIVKYDLYNDDYSLDQLLDAWVMFMHYHIETMFIKNEGSKLVLPSSLTYLKISLCSITSDALSTCIQSLVSLSKLELCHIQTITSLPPKEVLCSLKSLQSISIQECYLLSSLGGIGALTSLIELALNNCINLSTSNESLPLSLERLRFVDCSNIDDILVKSNLPVLRILCVWNTTFKNQRGVLHVGHLSCLEILSIIACDCRLEGLNSLTSLYTFVVLRCPEINFSTLMDKEKCALRAEIP
ncbi:putative disease resistance protein RGA1 [Carex rostrata]